MDTEFNASETVTIHKLGNNEFGLVYPDNPAKMEIWFDHSFDGSGCNNLVIDAFGTELDLEFCRSVEVNA